jgi:4-hydroxy-2-oxoheptanedioate aldolase
MRGLESLRNHETFGGWCSIPSAFAAELMGRAAFDWLCVDMQHGLVGTAEMAEMLQGIAPSGKPALVRVKWNSAGEIMRALDSGADGVIVPLVHDAENALRAARSCRYPPEGIRSWGGPVRAMLTRESFDPSSANSDVLCVVMVESAEGLANVADIAATPGVDGIFVGPSDLALSLGLAISPAPGSSDERDLDRALISIARACEGANKTAGIAAYGDLAQNIPRLRAIGYTLFTIAGDVPLLVHAAQIQNDLARGA